jgi:hypothetical protein
MAVRLAIAEAGAVPQEERIVASRALHLPLYHSPSSSDIFGRGKKLTEHQMHQYLVSDALLLVESKQEVVPLSLDDQQTHW